MVANLWRQVRIQLNIGWIAQDEVESTQIGRPFVIPPAAVQEICHFTKSKPFRIALRNGKRPLACVDRHSFCCLKHGQGGEEQCARTRPEIKDASGGQFVAKIGYCSLDQRFTVTARDQRIGGNRQSEIPKLLIATDIGDRFVRQTSLQKYSKAGRNIQIAGAQQHVVAADAKCMRHQQFGIEPGRFADCPQLLCRCHQLL